MDEITYDQVRLWILSEANIQQMSSLTDVIQMRRKSLGLQNARTFQPGDPVCFDAKRRGLIRGKFIRQMHKNAEVLADNGMTWKVPPILLRHDTPQQTPATAPVSVPSTTSP